MREVELVEGHQKAQQLAEENKELFKTVQQLRRQLQRLEGLKKRVLESISDEQSVETSEDLRLLCVEFCLYNIIQFNILLKLYYIILYYIILYYIILYYITLHYIILYYII